jgi:hypothetical protein
VFTPHLSSTSYFPYTLSLFLLLGIFKKMHTLSKSAFDVEIWRLPEFQWFTNYLSVNDEKLGRTLANPRDFSTFAPVRGVQTLNCNERHLEGLLGEVAAHTEPDKPSSFTPLSFS